MRATACFSMYSDMSTRIMAFSSSNRYSASARTSSVLPTPVGPRKMKLPMGRLGSLKPGAVAPDGVRDQAHGFVLADDAVLQALVHLDQLLDFAFHHAGDRNAGPLGDDAGDIVFVDLFLEERGLLDGFQLLLGRLDLLFDFGEAAVAQLRGLFPVAGAAGLLFFLAERAPALP